MLTNITLLYSVINAIYIPSYQVLYIVRTLYE